mmetsp:Transcript_12096/g.28896  ORF Transcript_12096/g.28896 Transcript_12096/m.28896 type:complete len:162 (+) Transcript_12096:236-721(+)
MLFLRFLCLLCANTLQVHDLVVVIRLGAWLLLSLSSIIPNVIQVLNVQNLCRKEIRKGRRGFIVINLLNFYRFHMPWHWWLSSTIIHSWKIQRLSAAVSLYILPVRWSPGVYVSACKEDTELKSRDNQRSSCEIAVRCALQTHQHTAHHLCQFGLMMMPVY